MNAAIFVRVSKKTQDYERQVRELTEYASKNNLTVVDVITEKISGRSVRDKRTALDELISTVDRNNVKKVLVSEVSRLGRKTRLILEILDLLHGKKVSVYIKNMNLETLNEKGKVSPIASLIITVMAELASLESENLSDRINSGLDNARANGKTFGRPAGSKLTNEQILAKYPKVARNLREGLSVEKTAKVCDVAVNTVMKVYRILKNK